jgi:hypothetical protein
MVKIDFGAGALFGEFELHNRVDTGIPIHYTPRLDNSLSGFDNPPLHRNLNTAAFIAFNALIDLRLREIKSLSDGAVQQ